MFVDFFAKKSLSFSFVLVNFVKVPNCCCHFKKNRRVKTRKDFLQEFLNIQKKVGSWVSNRKKVLDKIFIACQYFCEFFVEYYS